MCCLVLRVDIQKDVESMHEENHEVAKVVACSFVTKMERKKKLLQIPYKASIPLAPTPS